ncbi:hypothetical protein GCM10020255_028170 [Rhodococcus baikonurensis]
MLSPRARVQLFAADDDGARGGNVDLQAHDDLEQARGQQEGVGAGVAQHGLQGEVGDGVGDQGDGAAGEQGLKNAAQAMSAAGV